MPSTPAAEPVETALTHEHGLDVSQNPLSKDDIPARAIDHKWGQTSLRQEQPSAFHPALEKKVKSSHEAQSRKEASLLAESASKQRPLRLRVWVKVRGFC